MKMIFAPVGDLVPTALAASAKGAMIVCAGIHMSDIPSFRYSLLWQEWTITSVANLTRQDGHEFMALAPRIPIRTTTTAYALELLAWDVFLGLALLLAAQTLRRTGRERPARLALIVCGVLCLLGIVGPVVGNMRLQLAGVFGYAVVLPVAAFFAGRLFSAGSSGPEPG